ncbi:MAG: OmpA family protein [Subdoligranulum sp.]|nr:OmpA family protein [Subdoligranulum sp.]
MKKLAFVCTFVAFLTVALSGCGTAVDQEAVHPTTATAVIMLNGYNMPVVPDPENFVDAPQDGDATFIVVPDSTPSVTTLTWSTVANNPTYAASEGRQWKAELSDELSAVRPDSEGCDLLSAIHLAGNQLQSSNTQAQKLVILCSGVNTSTLDFANPAFWTADIDQMISQLQELDYIQPDLLQNVEVTWVYMTSSDGVHQASFTPAMQTRLYAFWDAYMQASGANTVNFRKDALTGSAPDNVPPIEAVAVDAITVNLPDVPASPAEEGPAMTLDTSTLAFVPDSDAFLDEQQASQTLDNAASQLLSNGGAYIIAGSVAATENGSSESSMRLSIARAQTVSEQLISRGVPEDSITAVIGLSTCTTPLRSTNEADNRAVYIVDASTDLATTLLTIGSSS